MIKSIRIKHFKAIEDSGVLKLGPLTVFVGHNGSGKSSIIEAIEFFNTYAVQGIDAAISPWFSYEHIWWKGAERKIRDDGKSLTRPLEIQMTGTGSLLKATHKWRAEVHFSKVVVETKYFDPGEFCPIYEKVTSGSNVRRERHYGELGNQLDEPAPMKRPSTIEEHIPLSSFRPRPDWEDWLFLSPDPISISRPRAVRSLDSETMERSGANLAGYLRSFIEKDPDGFESMVDSLAHILPYAANVESVTTSDLISKQTFFQLTESFTKNGLVNLPSWVLSGGTLRILSILTALRHPEPPPVLFIEELENGLDPRALGFLVEEIKYAIEEGQTQVIATTHSPYLLDKLSLDHIITVDREPGGPPVFTKASDNPELEAWSERFAPGSLYTMGMFRKKGGKQ